MEINELYNIFLENPFITTDTRKVKPQALFFALKGENFDGNKYAHDALQKGCLYAIVDDKNVVDGNKYILVNNVLDTLQGLANYHRKQLNIPIIAITGTNGKTTTKELIASVLDKKYQVSYTIGNFNNHIGVPLTLLSMTKDSEIGVVEMGANHPLEIKNLSEIAEPNYGIITNVGKAHIEGFGSFENVIKTKKELYDYIKSTNGLVFYNRRNEILNDIIKANKINNISYGDPDSDVNGEALISKQFLKLELTIDNSRINTDTNLIGNYNLENVLAAATIGKYFNVPIEKIIEAIQEYSPTNNRSQFVETSKNKLILDAYNANPTSVYAALENFANMDIKNKCIVLGDMLELGEESNKEHLDMIEYVKNQDFKHVLLVGEIYSSCNVPKNINQFSDVDELKKWLESNKIANSSVLIKGSRGIQLERIVENL